MAPPQSPAELLLIDVPWMVAPVPSRFMAPPQDVALLLLNSPPVIVNIPADDSNAPPRPVVPVAVLSSTFQAKARSEKL